ncbi:MAG: cobalt ECF transporter T component CbiQ [Peptococcaceae bacterium]|nr:cobalt ECF transporter T component CbiQ [Peptococcaceae bacterium]
MAGIIQSLYEIRFLDELAEKRTVIHNIHPLAKLLTTLIYIVAVVSFEKYEVSGLLPLIFYPVIIIGLAEIPLLPILKRLLLVVPFALGIGAFNPVFDHRIVFTSGWFTLTGGWVSFFSIVIKSILTVLAALTVIATTGMNRISFALRLLFVPRVLVLQLLLTYRYISVLMEEVARVLRAYHMRAPLHKGVRYNAWGSLAGNLLIRTFERAQNVYQAMVLRGFTGEYKTGGAPKITITDLLYLTVWTLFFAAARLFDIPALIGSLVTGVVK